MKSVLNEEQAHLLELCLDFTNTISWHASDHPIEHLHSYGDVVAWTHKRGIIDGERAEHLQTLANRHKTEAERTFQRAIEVREVIYRIFAAQAHGERAQSADLELLNDALADIATKRRIEMTDKGYRWSWVRDTALDQVVWPITRAAGDLLTNEVLLQRVGQCADDRGCGWLFLDLSKNHSRRWCDINDCGNRAKQRRYQQRQRGE